MPALTQARKIVEIEGRNATVPVKAATTIYQGGLVVMDAGWACPGRVAVNLRAVGLARVTVVNTGANGAASVAIERGVFGFANHPADAVTASDIGADCFIVDDQTVARTSATNTRSIAGRVVDIEDGIVFVRVGL